MKIKSIESLYNAFRVEIEKICTPEILKQLTTKKWTIEVSYIGGDEYAY